MERLLGIIGAVVLLAGIIDILWTTLWVGEGAGPITTRVTSYGWKAVRAIGRYRTLFSLFGPAILVLTIVVWVVLLWSGWTLLFSVDDSAIVNTSTNRPGDWADRLYFVGYTVFTLGNGDFSPNGRVWQLLTVLASGSGFVLLTLVITYIGSVISAVVTKRSFARQVTGFGTSPVAFLQSGWNGQDFHALDLPLSTLTTQLNQISEQHVAYPILHYYRSTQQSTSPAVALVVLDDALSVLRYGVVPESRPNPAVLASARAAVGVYLETLHSAFIEPATIAPPLPDLGAIRAAGISVDDAQLRGDVDDLDVRRRKLLGLVQDAGLEWPSG